MQAGRLNQRFILWSQTTTQDSLGQPQNNWTIVATLWADARLQGGMESIRNGAVTSVNRASVRVRYRAGILPGMRGTMGATTYSILAVLPDEAKKQYVDLVCEVVT